MRAHTGYEMSPQGRKSKSLLRGSSCNVGVVSILGGGFDAVIDGTGYDPHFIFAVVKFSRCFPQDPIMILCESPS